jgi:hypothetical protein
MLTAGAYAQQPVLASPGDSIFIHTLLETLETNSAYRIYSTIDLSFKVPFPPANLSPVQMLEKALADTPYRVSVYENLIFITKDTRLMTSTPFLRRTKESPDAGTGLFAEANSGKAVSENLVYVIGDAYAKEVTPKVRLSGRVTDSKTNKPLRGVNLFINEPYTSTATDDAGNYSLELPQGRVQLEISGTNIKNSRRQLMLYGNGILDIDLIENVVELDEVMILAEKQNIVKNNLIGMEKIRIARIKNIPTVLGETDILKVIQTLPGVKTVGEASTGFNVRGGATDQNLILLNNGTIYNPNHLFGFFTAFSSDMVSEAEIYKSSIPAQYGGRISSVLDITGKEANKEKFNGSLGIGLVTGKLNLEIPLQKEKTSLLLSGRTTYSDWILKQLPEKSGYNDGRAGFYDMGMVFSHKVNDKNNLNIYAYYSHDRFSFSQKTKYAYNNLNLSAKWKKSFNEKLFGTFAVGYDHYDYENTDRNEEFSAYKLSFDINQAFAKAGFSYKTDRHTFNFGFTSTLYLINSGTYEPEGAFSLVKRDQLQKDKALESAFYLGDEWEISSRFSVNVGLRYAVFNALGPRSYYSYDPRVLPSESAITDTLHAGSGKILKTWHGPEFRLSARYLLGENLSVKAGLNTMQQYIHKLSNTIIMSPTDTWKLSDANIRPQKGWQTATGLYYNTPNKIWESSVEVYYKRMNDYLDYRSGARILMNHHIETDVINTDGYAYGLELLLKKTNGKLNGWIAYTYSRTFLRQSDKLLQIPVNRGEWYPTDYDKPHDFKMIGNYMFTKRYSISVNADYSTGRPLTIPAGKFYDPELHVNQVFYTDRNTYRIPDYFRLDAAFNIEPSHKLTLLTHHTLSFGVYNITGRRNVYSIYFVSEEDRIKGYQLSIFGVPIPYVSYNIKF